MAHQPNTQLRAIRRALRLSQADLARAIRDAGRRTGEPNTCTPQQIQRWENGTTRTPHGRYLRALETATGQPAANLGFTTAGDRYGIDTTATITALHTTRPQPMPGDIAPLNGIWLSTYQYESTGRGGVFTSTCHMLLVQQGNRAHAQSLPTPAGGRILIDLTINGQVLTGNWAEETTPGGYYQGAIYYGVIQMLQDPTGRKLTGKWAGFGRNFDINTGPWTLELLTPDTSATAQDTYSAGQN